MSTRSLLLSALALALAAGGCGSSSPPEEHVVTGADFLLAPEKVHYGGSYTDWSVLWWQWQLEIPLARHPSYHRDDPTTFSDPQVDPVWFLPGVFGSLFDPPPPHQPPPATYEFTLPSGVALFFPLLSVEWDNDYCVPADWVDRTAAELAAIAYDQMNQTTDMFLEIDGTRVLDAPTIAEASRFRAISGTFSIQLPADNIATALCGWPAVPQLVSPAVADGVYVLIAPMPPGPHVLHMGQVGRNFYGELTPFEVFINITVVP